MKTVGSLALYAALVAASPLVSAQDEHQYPYSCTWTSELRPSAKIQFFTSIISQFRGALYLNNRWITNIEEGNSSGYGSNYWMIPMKRQDVKPWGGKIVLIENGKPIRPIDNKRTIGGKLLIVGLGESLYYNGHRNNGDLLQAADGFWLPGHGCRHKS